MIGVVAFSPDGTLATGSFSGAVSLWNPATGKMIGHTTVVADGPVAGLAFAPDGKTFATAGFGGATRIWETSTLQQFGTDFPSCDGPVGKRRLHAERPVRSSTPTATAAPTASR